MANHLLEETSQYLLQHADNPVDWYPWCDEAFGKALDENKPVFLSIGYSACHWCHVMAHESFEDPTVAAFLNEHFISIKVDREERPDLDQIYMTAVQAMTGQGGWPLSVFLTPDREPFYGGTYFPPAQRSGLPAFIDVLRLIAQAWQQRPYDLRRDSIRMVEALKQQYQAPNRLEHSSLQSATLDEAYEKLKRDFDHEHGGWGQAPKFPQPMVLEFLLRYYYTQGKSQAISMVIHTLESMARGGMYDQIGGGLHRYSVNRDWSIPHFEKMLYDNAQLARVYLHAWQLTDLPFFRTIAEETLDYVAREMVLPEGGFASSQDADSEGEEGKFYLWKPEEIHGALESAAESFLAAYGVFEQSILEGRSVLRYLGDLDDRPAHASSRDKLLHVRSHRVNPARDDKVIVSWNGLTLAAFAEAGRSLNRQDYIALAARNAEFLTAKLRAAKGRVSHSWAGGVVGIEGMLPDYVNLIEGLIELYQATFDERWVLAARQLAAMVVKHFIAPGGGFFDMADDAEALIVRPRELQDTSTPSGNAMAVYVLLRLSQLLVESRYSALATDSIRPIPPLLSKHPLAFAQWPISLHAALSKHREVAIVGDGKDPATRAFIEIARTGYRPLTLAGLRSSPNGSSTIPFLKGKQTLDGKPTVYVCSGSVCQPHTTDPSQLSAILDSQCL